MMPLWKKATSPTIEEVARDIGIKRTLTNSLSKSVRQLQQRLLTSGDENSYADVCHSLEGIFLHGLKKPFAKKVSKVFSSNRPEAMPEPDFWPVVMVYTHKNVLTQINSLSQITTDIGRCRAWLRLALNDALLVNYVEAMVLDKSTLGCYYRPSAYMRDREHPDILKQFLEGLVGFGFQLPVNCSALNYWNTTPLELAGLWKPVIAPEPVMPAFDVADFFAKENQTVKRASASPKPPIAQKSVSVQVDDLLEDTDTKEQGQGEQSGSKLAEPVIPESEAISSNPAKVDSTIVENLEEAALKEPDGSGSDNQSSLSGSVPDFDTESFSDESARPVGNLLTPSQGWSSPFDEKSESSEMTPEYQSYDSLVLSYTQNINQMPIGTPELRDLITSAMKSGSSSSENIVTRENSEQSEVEDLDFEVIPRCFNMDEQTSTFLSIIGIIQTEKGLDQQNYECHSCKCTIGMIGVDRKSPLCFYDGHRYCEDCHKGEEHVIPARIIHNWDFKKYPVSCAAKAFLMKYESEPLLDLRHMNPSLYSVVTELATLQVLRTQLGFLRSYLFTCSESISDSFKKMIWPREYLYEHIHLYSTYDLLQVPSGALGRSLQKAISLARKHVLSCQLCRQKGFVCEICSDLQVIYPFDTDSTHHCDACFAVYHKKCMEENRICPKCERKKEWEKVKQEQ